MIGFKRRRDGHPFVDGSRSDGMGGAQARESEVGAELDELQSWRFRHFAPAKWVKKSTAKTE
ncbi:hypothetical protein T439DRAFT_324121 [Meredithblackwellia eburnea MCA 4105]